MEKYLNRDMTINSFYNEFIVGTRRLDEADPDKYALMCGWTNKENQYKRFEVLTNIGISENDEVLDIGCGVGEFVKYLKEKELLVKYFGIDINPYYVIMAKNRFPRYVFVLSDSWDLETKVDWAIASGIFTIDSNLTFVLWHVGFVMEKLVRKGFAFNLLVESPHPDLVKYDPNAVKDALVERFPDYHIEVIQGYLSDDCTIYIKK
jgi:SAM-dependent methyltransferase